MSSLLIFGAGGHGKVVADAAIRTGRWVNVSFADDRYPELRSVAGLPVVATLSDAESLHNDYREAALGIGGNECRLELAGRLRKLGFELPAITHPSAVVASTARIDDATVLFANSVVQSDATVGFACIVNTSATIDHDCVISEGVHLSPGVHLSGEVRVGACSWLGIGASVIQNINIGCHVIVGGGSSVIRDIESHSVAVGVPARIIRKNEAG